MSEAAPAGPTANVVDADVSLVKPAPLHQAVLEASSHLSAFASAKLPMAPGIRRRMGPSPHHF